MKRFRASTTLIASLGLLLGSSSGFAANWTATSDGDWFDNANWSPSAPNAQGAAADFDAALTSDLTVTLDSPATVGSILFNSGSASSYLIDGPNTLTMDVASGSVVVNADSGDSNEVAVAMSLGNHELLVQVPTAGDRVILSGSISGSGGMEKFNDAGTVEILGDNTGWSGTKLLRVGRYGIGNDKAFGSGTLQVNTGTYYAVGGDREIANPINFGNRNFDGSNGFDVTFAGGGGI
ncbi:MAG: hypothetical protein ACOC1G_07020, partial [Phycisphaeraceae bacterium]